MAPSGRFGCCYSCRCCRLPSNFGPGPFCCDASLLLSEASDYLRHLPFPAVIFGLPSTLDVEQHASCRSRTYRSLHQSPRLPVLRFHVSMFFWVTYSQVQVHTALIQQWLPRMVSSPPHITRDNVPPSRRSTTRTKEGPSTSSPRFSGRRKPSRSSWRCRQSRPRKKRHCGRRARLREERPNPVEQGERGRAHGGPARAEGDDH